MENSFNDKIKETLDIVQNSDERSGKRFVYNLAQVEEEFALSEYSSVDKFDYVISHAISAIRLWAQIGNFKRASNNVEHILKLIPSDIEVSRSSKSKWMADLGSVPNRNNLKQIDELCIFLSNLKETISHKKEEN